MYRLKMITPTLAIATILSLVLLLRRYNSWQNSLLPEASLPMVPSALLSIILSGLTILTAIYSIGEGRREKDNAMIVIGIVSILAVVIGVVVFVMIMRKQ